MPSVKSLHYFVEVTVIAELLLLPILKFYL